MTIASLFIYYPPPVASQIKGSIYSGVTYRSPANQGKNITPFGILLSSSSIDDLGRPPQITYPDQNAEAQQTGTD